LYSRLAKGQTILQKKGHGHVIHFSDFISEEDGQLLLKDASGAIVKDAHKIIYPGAKGDAWWDMDQLLKQMRDVINIFEEAYPTCQALFVFDQSSAHQSLGPDALNAFEMNKSDGGKQWRQRGMTIPQNSPLVHMHGKVQKMVTESGEPKGLQWTLEECGFDVKKMKAKCTPRCPSENERCCMARLLSHQDDFVNQTSMLEELVTSRGHLCVFLPKFHCELNPIEMVCPSFVSHTTILMSLLWCYQVLGLGKVSISPSH